MPHRWLHRSQEIADWLIAFRRDLHQYPELSHRESRTASKIIAELQHLNLQIRQGVGGYGIIADLTGGQPGPTIALRADMDALPITESTELLFASEYPGVMHACGHDAHTAILLGAAYLLCEARDRLAGTVRFIFQPAEEVSAGARAMIREAALHGVDEIYGLHNLPTLESGKVAFRSGAMMASSDFIDITLKGRGGHSAMPEQSIDPIVAASAVVTALQTAVSREISPLESAVVTIGKLHAGEAYNVIPEKAVLQGTVRTLSPNVQPKMRGIIERIVRETSSAYRCEADLVYTSMTTVLENDANCTSYAASTAEQLLGNDCCIEAPPAMASEDFSEFLKEVPGCFFWIGSGPEEGAANAYGLHHPKFNLNERCIPLGSAILAAIAAGRLEATK